MGGVAGVPITRRVLARLDFAFFVLAGVLVVWFSYLTFRVGIEPGWPMLLILVFWGLVAYLALPRVHRILTRIYVPDYFIGRTRTSDGLLGDPVNLALMGTEDEIHLAMRAAGWTKADTLNQRTGWRIVTSTLSRRSYPDAPVSPLFLFRRQQDFAYQQEVEGSPSRRHHVRFWKCPDGWLLPGGVRVDWLAAGTYDRAVGVSLFTLQITHKISPDVDAERDHIIDTLLSSDYDTPVRVLPDFFSGYHARNGGGDRIETDGDLPVVDLTGIDVPPNEATIQLPVSRREARPLQITFGTAMIGLRGVVSVIFAIAGLIYAGSSAGLGMTFAALLLLMAGPLDIALAFGVYRGWNWARLAVCALTLFDAGSVLITRLETGPGLFGITDLVRLGINVLVLLALSSESATKFATRHWPRLPEDPPELTRGP